MGRRRNRSIRSAGGIDGVLFDDEVRLQQQHAGKLDPDRAGCLLVQRELEMRRLLERYLARIGATKDLREQSGAPFIGLGGGGIGTV